MRDIISMLLAGAGVLVVLVFAVSVDSLPFWLLAAVAALLWGLLIFLTVRDHIKRSRKTLWMARDGSWHALDGSQRSYPMTRRELREEQLFDQAEYDDVDGIFTPTTKETA